MKERVANVALLASLVVNILLISGWTRRDREVPEIHGVSQTVHARTILPSAANRNKVDEPAPDSALGLPWELLRSGPFRILDSDDLGPARSLPSSLDLNKQETHAFLAAATRLGKAWRALEVAGLQADGEREDHIVTIQINDGHAESAIRAFQSGIRTVMRPEKMRMFEDIVSRDPFLNDRGTTKLQISRHRSGLTFSHATNKTERTTSMTLTLIDCLALRWGHVIDFGPVRVFVDSNDKSSASSLGFEMSEPFFQSTGSLDSID